MSELPPDRFDEPKPPPPTAFEWTPELASGHAPGETEAPESIHRGRLVAIWVLSILATWLLAVIATDVRGSGTGDAFESGRSAGRLFGSVLAVYLIAALLVGVRALFARRGRRRRLFLSPFLPVLGVLVALVSFVGAARPASGTSAGTAAASESPAPSASPARRTLDEVLVIRAPYHLEASPTEESSEIVRLMTPADQSVFKSVDVRRIRSGSDLIGYTLLADASITPGLELIYLAQFERGVKETGASTAHTTIQGRDVLSGVSQDAGYAVWIEAPYLKIVITVAPEDAQKVAQSFVDG